MKALALLESPDHVSGRYRVSAYAPALIAAGWSLAVDGVASSPLARIRQLRQAGRFDAVIVQRKLLAGWQLRLLRSSVRRLIFDFDDAVLYRDSYDTRGPNCSRRAARFGAMASCADVVIAGNRFLATCASEHGASADRIRVIPTCVDTHSYALPPNHPPSDGRFRLVWVGSSSTLRGLEQRRPLLERLGREIPGLVFRVICDQWPQFESLEVERISWAADTEAHQLATADVGISLVPDDLWSRGKCGLKVIQYGAAGLPTVTDPVGVHTEIIREGMNGSLPKTDDEWVAAMRRLVSERETTRRMGFKAREVVEAEYSIEAWSSRFVAALGGQPPHSPKLSRYTTQAVQR